MTPRPSPPKTWGRPRPFSHEIWMTPRPSPHKTWSQDGCPTPISTQHLDDTKTIPTQNLDQDRCPKPISTRDLDDPKTISTQNLSVPQPHRHTISWSWDQDPKVIPHKTWSQDRCPNPVATRDRGVRIEIPHLHTKQWSSQAHPPRKTMSGRGGPTHLHTGRCVWGDVATEDSLDGWGGKAAVHSDRDPRPGERIVVAR